MLVISSECTCRLVFKVKMEDKRKETFFVPISETDNRRIKGSAINGNIASSPYLHGILRGAGHLTIYNIRIEEC